MKKHYLWLMTLLSFSNFSLFAQSENKAVEDDRLQLSLHFEAQPVFDQGSKLVIPISSLSFDKNNELAKIIRENPPLFSVNSGDIIIRFMWPYDPEKHQLYTLQLDSLKLLDDTSSVFLPSTDQIYRKVTPIGKKDTLMAELTIANTADFSNIRLLSRPIQFSFSIIRYQYQPTLGKWLRGKVYCYQPKVPSLKFKHFIPTIAGTGLAGLSYAWGRKRQANAEEVYDNQYKLLHRTQDSAEDDFERANRYRKRARTFKSLGWGLLGGTVAWTTYIILNQAEKKSTHKNECKNNKDRFRIHPYLDITTPNHIAVPQLNAGFGIYYTF